MLASDGAIMPGKQAHTCVVLDWFPFPVTLGMPFLADTDSTIDWYAKSVIFGD